MLPLTTLPLASKFCDPPTAMVPPRRSRPLTGAATFMPMPPVPVAPLLPSRVTLPVTGAASCTAVPLVPLTTTERRVMSPVNGVVMATPRPLSPATVMVLPRPLVMVPLTAPPLTSTPVLPLPPLPVMLTAPLLVKVKPVRPPVVPMATPTTFDVALDDSVPLLVRLLALLMVAMLVPLVATLPALETMTLAGVLLVPAVAVATGSVRWLPMVTSWAAAGAASASRPVVRNSERDGTDNTNPRNSGLGPLGHAGVRWQARRRLSIDRGCPLACGGDRPAARKFTNLTDLAKPPGWPSRRSPGRKFTKASQFAVFRRTAADPRPG